MCEMSSQARLHHLGEGLIRVPVGRPATVVIDPRRAGAVADQAIVEIIGELMAFKFPPPLLPLLRDHLGKDHPSFQLGH